MDIVTAHIYYSGIVQGVGFRFTVQHLARNLDLSGWVKNLSDGRVELKVSGTQEKITRFCRDIEKHFDGNIRNKEIVFSPAEDLGTQFVISR